MAGFYRVSAMLLSMWAGLCGLGQADAETDCRAPVAVCATAMPDAFPLIRDGLPVTIHVDEADWPGVIRAAQDLQADLAKVGGQEGKLLAGQSAGASEPVTILAGTLGRSPLIDGLAAAGRIDVSAIDGRWEGFVQAVVSDPAPGISMALVIAGTDKRGTIYGIYDLSERAGVSPWTWWADVPVPHQDNLSVAPGAVADWPNVKYRGIFLNDENPSLYGWANETFGGFNHDFYARVFELILRQKGNYIWPAMWGKAFWDDDPQNGPTADLYGVVVGTSHHEPLMRAHVEWERYGEGKWDFAGNADTLKDFWREGMHRMSDVESLVTIGMRGDGDEAMTEGTAISLLESIVAAQRTIIAEETGRPAEEQPQVWALYKEVQDYFDQGMQVPDDVTLLFSDDNWGNIRRLPEPDVDRPGGYGVYYHFDYVGGPRNYKWINTTQIERTWEQMNLAREYGADRLWIANVGDLKPMELPISFFLDYAWDPEDWPVERLPAYTEEWAAQQFGSAHATRIASMLDRYTKHNARVKPELLDADTYSLVNFGEWDRVVGEYEDLAAEADALLAEIDLARRDAFLQLVWYPVQASANLNAMYRAVAKNRLHAAQGRSDARDWADRAEALYARDAELTRVYHEDVAGGKWAHMMDQTHIGYTYWQQPDEQVMPVVERPDVPKQSALRVSVPGTERVWPGAAGDAALPLIVPGQNHSAWLDLFTTGKQPRYFKIRSNAAWMSVDTASGKVDGTRRVSLRIDWSKVPDKGATGTLTVSAGLFGRIQVDVPVAPAGSASFVSLPATDISGNVAGEGMAWKVIPNLGREDSSIALFPRTHPALEPREGGARLDYTVSLGGTGPLVVDVGLAPTLDFSGQGGMEFAVSLDGGAPVRVNANGGMVPDTDDWEVAVSSYSRTRTVEFPDVAAGEHVVSLWEIDPGLVYQSLVVRRDDRPDSHLAPPFRPEPPTSP